MHIKKINSQSRRDFYADYECEHCGNIHYNVSSYDDRFFHSNVIPNMMCAKCGKKADENYVPRATKYPDDMTV